MWTCQKSNPGYHRTVKINGTKSQNFVRRVERHRKFSTHIEANPLTHKAERCSDQRHGGVQGTDRHSGASLAAVLNNKSQNRGVTEHHAIRMSGRWGIHPGIPNLSTRWRRVVRFVTRSIYARTTQSGYFSDRRMCWSQGRYKRRCKKRSMAFALLGCYAV
jgi:hypothetical protein